MTEKMRNGVIKRGGTWAFVVTERGHFAAKDRAGNPKLDDEGQQIYVRVRQRWVGGFRTRKEAEAKRDTARHQVHRGTYVPPQDLTVATYLATWIEAHSVELKASTTDSYRQKIELYLLPAIGHERLQALSPSRLSVVWRDMHTSGGKGGKPVSPRTVEFARAVLRRAMSDAVVDRLIEVNPVTGSKLPRKQGKPQHTTWTGAQLQTFLDAVTETRWSPLWELAAGTGMRRGELLALAWEHVDLEAGVVAVERAVTFVKGERLVGTPKNHERRKIQLDPHVAATLRAWRKVQAEERLAWGAAYEDTEGLVFTWENGRPLLGDFVTKVFPKAQTAVLAQLAKAHAAAELTGSPPTLPTLTLHELRHSHATILLRAGVPVHIVSKRLGHKDPSVTLNVYADVIPDDDTSAVDVFSKAVWNA